jgi:hypothetical protein
VHAALPPSRVREVRLLNAYACPGQLVRREREYIESGRPSATMYAAAVAAGPSPSSSITIRSGRTGVLQQVLHQRGDYGQQGELSCR